MREDRFVRGAATALVATFVALASHVLAGGAMPGAIGVLAPLVIALPLAIACSTRRLPLLGTIVGVSASQLLFHTLFVLGAPVSGGTAGGLAHVHNPSLLVGVALDGTVSAPLDAEAALGSMIGMHLVAATITVLYLTIGHRVSRSLSRVLKRLTMPSRIEAVALPAMPRLRITRPIARLFGATVAAAGCRGPPR